VDHQTVDNSVFGCAVYKCNTPVEMVAAAREVAVREVVREAADSAAAENESQKERKG